MIPLIINGLSKKKAREISKELLAVLFVNFQNVGVFKACDYAQSIVDCAKGFLYLRVTPLA